MVFKMKGFPIAKNSPLHQQLAQQQMMQQQQAIQQPPPQQPPPQQPPPQHPAAPPAGPPPQHPAMQEGVKKEESQNELRMAYEQQQAQGVEGEPGDEVLAWEAGYVRAKNTAQWPMWSLLGSEEYKEIANKLQLLEEDELNESNSGKKEAYVPVIEELKNKLMDMEEPAVAQVDERRKEGYIG